jgi:FkbM family methyltransferase
MKRTRRFSPLWLANWRRIPEVFTCTKETAQWLPVTLAYLGLRSLAYPFELRLRGGEVLVLQERTDLVIFWLIFARRHYPVCSSDRLIVDVGANIGLFTMYAARQAPEAQIISIEPFPETGQRLRSLVETNRLTERVTILNCAVSGSSGTAAMDAASAEIPSQYKRINSATTRVLNPKHRGEAAVRQAESGVSVRTETLQQVIESVKATRADLLKMNIHGSEYEVLMSTPLAALQSFRRIAVQYHQLPAEACVGKDQLFEHLARAGFQLISDEDTMRGSGLAVFAARA